MARISAASKQQIINQFMNETGANTVVPIDFLNWLEPQTDHVAWDTFFSKSEAEQAKKWRVDRFRTWASGTTVQVILPLAPVPTAVTVPWITTVHGVRSEYQTNDATDPDQRNKLLADGLSALKGWHKRYSGTAQLHGCPVDFEIGAAIAKLESSLTG